MRLLLTVSIFSTLTSSLINVCIFVTDVMNKLFIHFDNVDIEMAAHSGLVDSHLLMIKVNKVPQGEK